MTDTRRLLDLHAWLPTLITHHNTRTSLHSPRPTPPTHTPNTGLPYGITIDNPDEPADSTTPAGIMLWAATWAQHFQTIYGRNLGDSLTYLATIAETAASAHADDWDCLSSELAAIHTRTAATLGYTDTTDPDHACPACGSTIQQHPGENGLSDYRTCNSCDTFWPNPESIDATRHHTITTTQAPVYCTRTQALTIHPDLKADTLKKWITRGHVTTDQRGRVNLADVNGRMQKAAA